MAWNDYAYFGQNWRSNICCLWSMPDMISLLDQTRDMLEELSPELGVTDPVSGNVIFES